MTGRLLLMTMLSAVLAAGEPTADQAVDRGLAWLRARQSPDGLVSGRHRVACTALAALAHLAAGVTPEDAAAGDAVRRMLRAVLDGADDAGWFGGDGGRMYSHGVACLALAAGLGASRDPDLDERLAAALRRAVGVTIAAAQVAKAEGHRGGWRYQRDEATSDVSATGWQIAALAAARRSGVAVSDAVLSDALAYLRGRVGEDGRVGYQRIGEDRPALRGVALLALSLPGGERDTLRDRVLARMQSEPPAWTGPWFYYRAWHDAAGLAQTEPEAWPAYRERLHRILVDNQSADGSWPAPPGDNEREEGPAYATAMALLALTVDRRLLP